MESFLSLLAPIHWLAIGQIIVANLVMSIDNVMSIAGAAQSAVADHLSAWKYAAGILGALLVLAIAKGRLYLRRA